tara:strand:+ start:224 stop:559 length:336 start_codon:yes stop_codon:yes gene_type:complete
MPLASFRSAQINEHRLSEIRGDLANFAKAKNAAVDSLHASRHQMIKFVHVMADSGTSGIDESSAIKAILSSYRKTIAITRDRRETASLVEALQDLGDFHITLGHVEEAKKR